MSIRLMLLCAAVCGSTLFFNACATKEAVPPQPEKKSTPVPVKAEKKQAPLPRKAEKKNALVPVAPVNGAQVSLLNAGQKAFLNMPRAERTAFFADPAKRKQLKKNGYYPEPVHLKWNWNGKNNPEFTVTVTREQDKTPVFSVKTKETEAAVWNLEIARNYTWTVSADGKTASATFKTEDQAPRLLRIKGVPNVRDLGGRIGLDGKRVKQSLVYRTAGLNDNASEVKYTRDELYGKYGEALKEKEKNLLAQIGNLREFQKKPASLNLVSIKLSPEWKVFLMKGSITAPPEIPSAIPAEYNGKKPITVKLDANGKFTFHKRMEEPAIFMQEFNAPADGWAAIGCGADWFWSISINGKLAFDRVKAGNAVHPISAENYQFLIPVKEGKNVLAAMVFTGADSWTWCCSDKVKNSVPKMLQTTIDNKERYLRELFAVVKEIKPGKSRLSPATLDYMLKELGIKSDLDLRSDRECYGMTGSPLGKDVNWFHISSAAYGGMQSDWGKEAFKRDFRIFLDPKNYPIDFHCIAGQDRTGALAFILNGLLGVSEEELYKDWEATGFWNPDPHFNHKNRFDHLVAVFAKYPGKNINEKIENYVLSCGFTKEDIAKFRSMMLE